MCPRFGRLLYTFTDPLGGHCNTTGIIASVHNHMYIGSAVPLLET